MMIRNKIIAVCLSVILLILLSCPVFAVSGPGNKIPILKIRGEQTVTVRNSDGEYHELFDDGEYVSEILDKALPDALKAVVTGNWETWSRKALDILRPAFDGFKPDEHGNVSPDSKVFLKQSASEYTFMQSYSVEGGGYQYVPDMRISPMDEADDLKAVIDRIKELTGQDKIILIGQCAGNAYLMAYLQKYEEPNDFSGVEAVLFSTTTTNGSPAEDRIFSGNVEFKYEPAYRALRTSDYPEITDVAGGMLLQLLYDTLDLVYRGYLGKKLTCSVINSVYEKISDCFIAEILREYYGRCGGYVSCVVEHYEEYKDYVFPTEEAKTRYAENIAKFDDYYYNVCLCQPRIIAGMLANGVSVNCLSEYGVQSRYSYIGDAALETSDFRIPVSLSSYGAVGRNIGDPFSQDYIERREALGLGDYISPDRTVDASSALLRDNTWFVKNADHRFDPPVMALASAILLTPDATVDKLKEQGISRFMYYTDSETALVPVSETETDDSPVTPAAKTFVVAYFRWIKTLFRLIAGLLGNS